MYDCSLPVYSKLDWNEAEIELGAKEGSAIGAVVGRAIGAVVGRAIGARVGTAIGLGVGIGEHESDAPEPD
jgi:uncharacterized membrane protein